MYTVFLVSGFEVWDQCPNQWKSGETGGMDIINQINHAIDVIESFEQFLISNVADEKQDYSQIITYGVLSVFPVIVDSYEAEELAEYREQIYYWDEQWDRIKEALERNDSFFLIDVLSNETKNSFREYLNMIEQVKKEKS